MRLAEIESTRPHGRVLSFCGAATALTCFACHRHSDDTWPHYWPDCGPQGSALGLVCQSGQRVGCHVGQSFRVQRVRPQNAPWCGQLRLLPPDHSGLEPASGHRGDFHSRHFSDRSFRDSCRRLTGAAAQVVTPDGFEPSTCRLGGGRSIP